MESSLIYLFTSPYSVFIPALRDEGSIKNRLKIHSLCSMMRRL